MVRFIIDIIYLLLKKMRSLNCWPGMARLRGAGTMTSKESRLRSELAANLVALASSVPPKARGPDARILLYDMLMVLLILLECFSNNIDIRAEAVPLKRTVAYLRRRGHDPGCGCIPVIGATARHQQTCGSDLSGQLALPRPGPDNTAGGNRSAGRV